MMKYVVDFSYLIVIKKIIVPVNWNFDQFFKKSLSDWIIFSKNVDNLWAKYKTLKMLEILL